MKKSWRAAVLAAALSIVFGGMSVVSAQQEEQQPPIAGGYAETSKTSPEVVSAARYATRAQGRRQGVLISLVSIERAEVQVVAGLNYRLQLKIKIKGEPQTVRAVVYQNLRRRYSLTDWEVDPHTVGIGSAVSLYTIEGLAKAFAEAYEAKSLGRLDGQRLIYGNVKIVTDDSLSGKRVTRVFKTFARAERWLRSLEVSENIPHRQTMPLEQCSKGVCTFNFDNGILHNQLYLQEITYGYRGGRPYIKKISLLDGD
ncbi:MAG TPA: hypothetical protein VM095_11350 [Pyrinomonadaceae bacterium]|nr:hypothetical protein [Pyrinomonadaceae bacterium]